MLKVCLAAFLSFNVCFAAQLQCVNLLSKDQERVLRSHLRTAYSQTKRLWPQGETPQTILEKVKSGAIPLKGEDSDVIDRLSTRHKVIGPLDRNLVHFLGLYHKATVMFVYVRIKGKIKLVVQQYFGETFNDRGLFIVGGHIKAGETKWIDVARREIVEELGFPADHSLSGSFLSQTSIIKNRPDNPRNRELIGVFHYMASDTEAAEIEKQAKLLKSERARSSENVFMKILLDRQYDDADHRTGLGEIWDIYFLDAAEIAELERGAFLISEFGAARTLPVDAELAYLLEQPRIRDQMREFLSH